MTGLRYAAILLLLTAIIGGCASQIDPALEKQRQLQVQRMQTRVFDTRDRKLLIRGVIAAMQDLNFIISNANIEQGVITAKRFGPYTIEMTVTVQPISDKRILVHGIARYNLRTLEDPFLYEQFFSSLQDFASLVAHAGN